MPRWFIYACVFALPAPLAHADTPLRIVTFNAEVLTAPGVHAGQVEKFRWEIARRRQFEQVAAVVETLNPDVLNLVEVTSREGVDLLIEILHEKGLTDLRGYHVENNDTYTGMDVALITRLEPVPVGGQALRTLFSETDDPTWRQTYHYTTESGRRVNKNGSLTRNAVSLFDVAGWKLGFLGLHLKSGPSDEFANAQRAAQALIAQRMMRAEIVGRGYLPIVLGDLNDYDADVEDRDPERSTLTTVLHDLKDYDSQHPGDELVNVASLMPRVADRYTSFWDRNENRARDPYDVFTMIDHILLPVELVPYVQRAFICHSIPDEASDHRAVVVDLLLPSRTE